MPTHWGATLGLIGTVIVSIKEYREGGWHSLKRSWTGLDDNYPGEWFPERIRAPLPMIIGGVATKVAIWTGYNMWTPKDLNV